MVDRSTEFALAGFISLPCLHAEDCRHCLSGYAVPPPSRAHRR